MRQAGFLAAACSYALDNHVERLAEDHRRAALFAQEVPNLYWIDFVREPETNLVILALKEVYSAPDFLAYLKTHGILTSGMGGQNIRFAFHLHHSDEDVAYTLDVLKKYKP
jgi:threonine aldolase